MRRPFFLAIALLGIAGPVLAAPPCRGPEGLPEPGAVPAPVPHHFHRADGRLGCVLSRDHGEAIVAGTKPTTLLPCLRIGAVAVADDLKRVEKLLGPPDAVQSLDWRTESRAYVIPQRGHPRPYYVVTYRDDVAVAVQLLGEHTEMPATFSAIALGDPAQKVLDVLGRPESRCPIAGKDGESWIWPPFPIAVDLRDGRVVGMKATWPAGK